MKYFLDISFHNDWTALSDLQMESDEVLKGTFNSPLKSVSHVRFPGSACSFLTCSGVSNCQGGSVFTTSPSFHTISRASLEVQRLEVHLAGINAICQWLDSQGADDKNDCSIGCRT